MDSRDNDAQHDSADARLAMVRATMQCLLHDLRTIEDGPQREDLETRLWAAALEGFALARERVIARMAQHR